MGSGWWYRRYASRGLRGAALALVCGAAAPALAAADASSAMGLREPGGFVTLSPGPGGMTLGPETLVPRYIWGLDGGYHFAFGRRFALQLGGYLDHSPHRKWALVRLGGVLRIGGGNERVFGYGLVRVGVDVDWRKAPIDTDGYENGGEGVDEFGNPVFERQTFVLFAPSGGGGVMWQPHRVVGLGGEVAADLAQDNGVHARLRLFLTLKF